MRMGEREGVHSMPLYEVPIIARLYELQGGRVEVRGTWPRGGRPGARVCRRSIGLSRLEWQAEVERLRRIGRIRLPGRGTVDLFADIYDKDGSRLIETVRDQLKAWAELEKVCREQGNRQPTSEEASDIALKPLGRLSQADYIDAQDVLVEDVDDAPLEEATEAITTEDPATPALADALANEGVPKGISRLVTAELEKGGQVTDAWLDTHKVIGPAIRKTPALRAQIFEALAAAPDDL